jgi:hypothetical protein
VQSEPLHPGLINSLATINAMTSLAQRASTLISSIRLVIVASAISASMPCLAQVESNAELAKLYSEDQADREKPPQSIDWSVVGPRDEARRAAVIRILQTGGVRTASDYHAAAMVFQHGPTASDIQLAYSLAAIGSKINPDDKALKWLSAAAWDRNLMHRGKPQWYGTQYKLNETTKRFELYEVDSTAVTDEERAQLNVPSLAKAKEREAEFNR